jgi:hypothetical protein
MPGKNTLGVAAPKGENLTLDDYAAFVEQARQAGIPGDTVPTAKIRPSGKVRALTVQAKDAPPDDGGGAE